jgi:hypothetical protein
MAPSTRNGAIGGLEITIMKPLFVAAAFALLLAQSPPVYQDPRLPLERRVDDLLARMTLAEKISQLMNDSPERSSDLPFPLTTGGTSPFTASAAPVARRYCVVYEPGELRVVAYKNGKAWAGVSSRSTAEPFQLLLTADRATIAPDGERPGLRHTHRG